MSRLNLAGTHTSRVIAYAGFAILSLMWGLSFVAIKRADAELSSVNLTLLRWLVASALFLGLVPFLGKPKTRLERKDLPRILLVAFTSVTAYHLSLNYAEKTVSAGLAGLLISLGPIFALVLSIILLREKADARVVFALVLAISGTVILSIGSISLNDLSSLLGVLAVILSAFSYASYGVLSKPLVAKYGAAPTTILAGLIGTVMMTPLLSQSLVAEATSLSETGWIAVLYLSVVSSTIGYLLFFSLVSKGRVSRLFIQLYLIPVVSVAGGVLLLGELLTIWILVGGGMILAAVALATWKPTSQS